MTRATVVAACVAFACATDAPAVGNSPQGTWRGDVSYPGLPAIGVLFDIDDDDAPRIIAAPNMGFGGGRLDDFVLDDSAASFRWSLNDDPYECALRRQSDGTLLGPCTSPDAPTIGVRMVPRGVAAPTGLARAMLEMSSVQWLRVDSGTTTVWAPAGTHGRVLRDSVAAAVRRARADNAALFGDVAHTLPVDVFLVADRQDMARVVRRTVAGWTDPMAATVAIVGMGEHSVGLRHELTHAISFNAWGAPHEGAPWLAEGLATWIAGECGGYAVHDLARGMRERGELIPLRTLIDAFPQQDDVVAYLQSGSVVGYILETYGVDAFRRVWTGGADALGSLGLDVDRLERDWLGFVDTRPAVADRERIRAHGCG